MCAIYGFLNYGRKVKNRVLKSILRELSIAAECRGTDATGISYVKITMRREELYKLFDSHVRE